MRIAKAAMYGLKSILQIKKCERESRVVQTVVSSLFHRAVVKPKGENRGEASKKERTFSRHK